jgi:hypothetical protein
MLGGFQTKQLERSKKSSILIPERNFINSIFMTKLFVLLVLLTAISACKESPNKSNALPAARDLIMGKYFDALDSLHFSDTLNQEYKLIKAYHSNDTDYLKQRYAEITEILKAMQQEVNLLHVKSYCQ